ncbi:vacuoloar ATP synthase subunit D, putative [Cryptosporidium muris RN66]|uniref:V-type proton ATPase subunit n=1 Tax=Cryptosporidium muris (strain RN66) TaxID=441375 RepID=B6ACI1_CRYMR|nr:vacuoloar ATP synthase subunit D, putative [Cryptosporidium muris RN66]EEA05835.1 vacuoloar ATP synthase subunit D, putative [Cryptosporidium muris RN66]|eukprot:XP_002140184.1 vacuoloar ATP synthase subunit D [Cryptosporidium muris RN66]
MEMLTFNLKDGHLEAMVRGFRSGFLTMEEYNLIGQAETLEDMRTAMEETDYGTFLQDEPLSLSVTRITQKCREKFASEFRLLRSQAYEPLATFLDYITYEKMIDNVINVIQGAINKKPADELLSRLDPLGYFPEIRAFVALDLSSSFDELYKSILIDTSIGPYFDQFLRSFTGEYEDVTSIVKETDLEILRNFLKKSWLEDFYEFCQTLNSTTKEVMSHILKSEADFRLLAITLNSLNFNLANTASLYPNFGYLYPEGTEQIRKAWNDTRVRAALEPYTKYYALYEQCKTFYVSDNVNDFGLNTDISRNEHTNRRNLADRQFKSLEDLLYAEIVSLCELAFEQQMNYGVFYAWTKLKEQEIRNITWIADMILMKRRDQVDAIVPIFAPRV